MTLNPANLYVFVEPLQGTNCSQCFERCRAAHAAELQLRSLTDWQLAIVAAYGAGLSVPEIARLIKRSVKTVEKHKNLAYAALGIKNTQGLCQLTERAGLRSRLVAQLADKRKSPHLEPSEDRP